MGDLEGRRLGEMEGKGTRSLFQTLTCVILCHKSYIKILFKNVKLEK